MTCCPTIIWVKKTLLKAQGDSTYKWVPKQLLKQATIPAKPPANKKNSSPQRTWPKRQIKEKWIPTTILTQQGYYNKASYIGVPKHKEGQEEPKQLKASKDHQPKPTAKHNKDGCLKQRRASSTQNPEKKSLNNQTS